MGIPFNIEPNAVQKTAQPRVVDEKAKAKLQKAAKDFEAIFVNYLLQSMRKTVQKDEEEGGGFGGEMMMEMFDQELSKNIARKSSLGFGEMLYKKMTGESLPKETAKREIVRAITSGEKTMTDKTPFFPKLQTEAVKTEIIPIKKGKSTTVVNAVEKYNDIVNRAAAKYDLDTSLIKAVIASESAGNPHAHSSANAKGLMQLIDSTATMVGVKNVWDPEQNIHGGTKYLKQLMDKFDGDVKLAVASYNAGPAKIEKTRKIPAIPETQQYVRRVMNYIDVFSIEKD
ncbi:MAG TPA: murein transglycosylase [Bacteroidetes bacterium]|nr:murein transglycosylase [Bacteroidota bacterium]